MRLRVNIVGQMMTNAVQKTQKYKGDHRSEQTSQENLGAPLYTLRQQKYRGLGGRLSDSEASVAGVQEASKHVSDRK